MMHCSVLFAPKDFSAVSHQLLLVFKLHQVHLWRVNVLSIIIVQKALKLQQFLIVLLEPMLLTIDHCQLKTAYHVHLGAIVMLELVLQLAQKDTIVQRELKT